MFQNSHIGTTICELNHNNTCKYFKITIMMKDNSLNLSIGTCNTVDGSRNAAPVEVGSLSQYLQGFIHPRWLFGVSSINSMTVISIYPYGCFLK